MGKVDAMHIVQNMQYEMTDIRYNLTMFNFKHTV